MKKIGIIFLVLLLYGLAMADNTGEKIDNGKFTLEYKIVPSNSRGCLFVRNFYDKDDLGKSKKPVFVAQNNKIDLVYFQGGDSPRRMVTKTIPPRENKIKVSGKAEVFACQQFNHGKNNLVEVRILPEAKVALSEEISFYGQADIRIDNQNYASGVPGKLTESDERYIANIREAYFNYWGDGIQFKIGKQIFDWSVTDTVSPTDNINSRDWNDFLDWKRVGVPAFDLKIGFDNYVEAVLIPIFTPSKMSTDDNPWNLLAGMDVAEQEVDDKQMQFALRTGMILGDYDLTLSYYNGYSYNPFYKINPVSNKLTPYYSKEQVFASSVSKQIFGSIVRAEVGYFAQEDQDDFWQFVCNIDRQWSGIFKPTDNLYALIQYSNEKVTNPDNGNSGIEQIDFRRIFTNSLMGKVEYEFDQNWSIAFEGSYNLSDKDSYIEPSVKYKNGNFAVEIGVDIMSGPQESFWGRCNKNDRLYAKLSWSF